MDKLQAYHWPGNVRELKNTIQRLVIMMPESEITALDLPISMLKSIATGSNNESKPTWQKAREEFEREFILRSLVENDGNISRTAAAIGMERSHLHRKLKAYNIK